MFFLFRAICCKRKKNRRKGLTQLLRDSNKAVIFATENKGKKPFLTDKRNIPDEYSNTPTRKKISYKSVLWIISRGKKESNDFADCADWMPSVHQKANPQSLRESPNPHTARQKRLKGQTPSAPAANNGSALGYSQFLMVNHFDLLKIRIKIKAKSYCEITALRFLNIEF